jgi:hypothetical protein
MLFKFRRHERYNVRSGTFVIVSPGTDGERKVQIVDVSMGGAAFIYDGSPEELDTSGILNLLVEKTSLEKVNFDTVSDIPIPGCTQPSETFRRRGVKFKWLGVLDKAELSKFIKMVSTFGK